MGCQNDTLGLYCFIVKFSISIDDLTIKAPKNKRLGIGLIGCGEIAREAHLPAYTDLGLQVNACYDVRQDVAESVAKKFGIPNVCSSLEEIVSRQDVQIIDIAFHLEGRLEAVSAAGRNGKHILIQKPLAHSLETAEQLVQEAEKHGVLMQVNQQARWAPTFLATKKWLEKEAIGRLNFLRLEMRGWQDDPNKWYVHQEDMTLVDHGIHYFDLLRYFAGKDPVAVAAMQSSVPGQKHISPTIYAAIIDFGEDLIASHNFNNKVETPEPWEIRITLDGEEGTIFTRFNKARLTRKDGVDIAIEPQGAWFPDAFAGPMVDLMDAITENRKPVCSARENLPTLSLVLGALKSARERKLIQL